MKKFDGYMHGIGIGGWLTNYRRFKFIPRELRTILTEGDIQHFDTYITQQDIDAIASWGCDHIRLAFDYLVLEDEENPFVYKEEGFKYLDNCLQWCKQAGINLLFDLHKAPGSFCDNADDTTLDNNPQEQERFVQLWRAMAERYRGEGDHVAFELLNEVGFSDHGHWNALAKRAIDGIRGIDAQRKIVVGTNWGNAPEALKFLEVYDDDNVVYTFHCYAPWEFTHQRAVIIPMIASFNRYMDYPGDLKPYYDYKAFAHEDSGSYDGLERMDRKFLERVLQPAVDFRQQHPDKALCCSEFGVIRHANMQSRENYYRDIIAICDEHGIGHSAWNYLSAPYDANRFSIVDDWDRKPLSEELIRIIR
ncbi:MAG TPA: glycoside hydrolase family 5 protein [Armatimonadota bacterium]|nr:glycoside hydrolase family 5 protein [Armatimonadota bacterium]